VLHLDPNHHLLPYLHWPPRPEQKLIDHQNQFTDVSTETDEQMPKQIKTQISKQLKMGTKFSEMHTVKEQPRFH
jgi:hypothetical protein